MADYQVGSGYSLSGYNLGKVAVKSFSNLKMEVETSSTQAGNTEGGKRSLQPRPGPTKPGEPTFVAPIENGALPLAKWWADFNPNAIQGKYQPQDLIFSFEGENGPFAQWQLIGVFPKSYEVSSAEVGSAELATETITLCVTQIVRMM